jgi:hypothetical protein
MALLLLLLLLLLEVMPIRQLWGTWTRRGSRRLLLLPATGGTCRRSRRRDCYFRHRWMTMEGGEPFPALRRSPGSFFHDGAAGVAVARTIFGILACFFKKKFIFFYNY